MKFTRGFILFQQLIINVLAWLIIALSTSALIHYDVFLNKTEEKIYLVYQSIGVKALIQSWVKRMGNLYCQGETVYQKNNITWMNFQLLKISKESGYLFLPEGHWVMVHSLSNLNDLEEGDYLFFNYNSVKVFQLEQLQYQKTPYQVLKVNKQYFSFHKGAFLIGKYPQIVADGLKDFKLEFDTDLLMHVHLNHWKWSFKICPTASLL